MDISNSSLIRNYTLSDVQKNPLQFLKKLVADEKALVIYKVNGQLVALLNNSDSIKRILLTNNRYYIKEGTPEMFMLKPILGDGMLTSDGDLWKLQRNIAQEAFSREKILTYFNIMVEEANKMVNQWQPNATIDLEAELSQLTLRIVGKSLFGKSLETSEEKFGAAVTVVNKYMGHYDPFDREGRIQFSIALKSLKSLVFDIISERKQSKQQYNDLLSILLKNQTDEESDEAANVFLTDQIFTFLMAGHETTAKALTWTFYELYKNPDKLELLEEEVDNILKGQDPNEQGISKLNFTWQVLRESMRLNPPVWIISRTAGEDDIIEGVNIPKGTTVLVSPYLMHRNNKYWRDPESFIPERFSEEEEKERNPYAFIPYSAGPRRCIGMNFANLEMLVIISKITQKYRLRLKPGFVVEHEALVTLRPKNGMQMIIDLRN